MKNMKSPRSQFSGFTLIELLVVIAIIGLLSTLAIVALGTARAKSRDARRSSDLKQLRVALEMYNSETGIYPVTTSTILLGDASHACLGSNGFKASGGCDNQYISVPKDPNGENYIYLGMGNDYIISAVLEGATNDLSGVISATPNGGIFNGSTIYGLIGWWKFDEGSGTVAADSSWNFNPGELKSGANWMPGNVGSYAVNFDGTKDRVHIASADYLKYRGGNLTLTSWVYLDPADNTGGCFFSKPWNSVPTFNYKLCTGVGGDLHLDLGGATTWSLAGPTISKGVWHLVAVVLDSAGLVSIYVDNFPPSSGINTISNWNATDEDISFCLGTQYPYNTGWAGNSTLAVQGKIDDFRVYSRALADSDIGLLYNSQR